MKHLPFKALLLLALSLAATPALSQPAKKRFLNEFGIGLKFAPGKPSDPPVLTGERVVGGFLPKLKGATLLKVGPIEIKSRAQYRPSMRWLWCRAPLNVRVNYRKPDGGEFSYNVMVRLERGPSVANMGSDVTSYAETFTLTAFCMRTRQDRKLGNKLLTEPKKGRLTLTRPDGARIAAFRFVKAGKFLKLMVEIDFSLYRKDLDAVRRAIAKLEPHAGFEELVIYDAKDKTKPVGLFISSAPIKRDTDLRAAIIGLPQHLIRYQQEIIRQGTRNIGSDLKELGFDLDAKLLKHHVEKCEAGDSESCMKAGALSFNSKYLPRRPARGLGFYAKACAQKHVNGCLAAGQVSESGDGVPKDVEAARKYYRAACDIGGPAACISGRSRTPRP